MPLVNRRRVLADVLERHVDDAVVADRLAPASQHGHEVPVGNVVAQPDAIEDVRPAEPANVALRGTGANGIVADAVDTQPAHRRRSAARFHVTQGVAIRVDASDADVGVVAMLDSALVFSNWPAGHVQNRDVAPAPAQLLGQKGLGAEQPFSNGASQGQVQEEQIQVADQSTAARHVIVDRRQQLAVPGIAARLDNGPLKEPAPVEPRPDCRQETRLHFFESVRLIRQRRFHSSARLARAIEGIRGCEVIVVLERLGRRIQPRIQIGERLCEGPHVIAEESFHTSLHSYTLP